MCGAWFGILGYFIGRISFIVMMIEFFSYFYFYLFCTNIFIILFIVNELYCIDHKFLNCQFSLIIEVKQIYYKTCTLNCYIEVDDH